MAKHKYITIGQMKDMWAAYKADLISNPRIRKVLCQKTAEMVDEELRRPFTMEGFSVFCRNYHNVTISHYFDNTDNAYEEYRGICSHIREEIRQDQIEGGMVGQYNHSITQRLNGLTEKQENTITANVIHTTLDLGNEIPTDSNSGTGL